MDTADVVTLGGCPQEPPGRGLARTNPIPSRTLAVVKCSPILPDLPRDPTSPDKLTAEVNVSIYPTDGPLIYKSSAFKEVITKALDAGGSSAPLLITGSPGVGKGVLARFVHAHGVHREYPFIDWMATGHGPASMLGSLLGEMDREGGREVYREGALGEADGGTLLIRHIEYDNPKIQKAIGRLLCEGTYRVPGMKRERKLNVRIIFTAYPGALGKRVTEKNVILPDVADHIRAVIHVPPLADRREDVRGIYEYWSRKISEERGINRIQPTEQAFSYLELLPLKGNIWDLFGVIKHNVFECKKKNTSTVTIGEMRKAVQAARVVKDGGLA